VIGFTVPEDPEAPLQLSARMTDSGGGDLLKIRVNEWIAGIHHFDVETTAGRLTIRRKLGDITLQMIQNPNGEIVLDRLQMRCGLFTIKVDDGWLCVQKPIGGEFRLKCPNIHSTMRLTSSGSVMI
jgi:hypothetical protein